MVLTLSIPTSVLAATRTWTGGGATGNWSDSGNWGGNFIATGDDLVFPGGAARLSNNNDVIFTPNSITFTGSGYTITGFQITLGAGGIKVTETTAGYSVQFNVDIALTGASTITFNGTQSGTLSLGGAISGTGPLTASSTVGDALALNGTNTYTGGSTFTNLSVSTSGNSPFGSGAVSPDTSTTIEMGFNTISNVLNAQGCGHAGNNAINGTGTWAGQVNDATVAFTCFGSDSNPLTISGPLTGTQIFRVGNGSSDVVIVNGGGSYSGQFQILAGTLVVNSAFATASGLFSNTNSTLEGTGTIGGPVQFLSTGHFTPGPSTGGPSIFNTGALTMGPGSNLDIDLNGTTAGSGYDQINVGTSPLPTTITGANLNVNVGFVPAVGNTFTILQTAGPGAIVGTFAGKPNGSTFVVGATTLSITYNANSVVLTVTAAVGVPVMPKVLLLVLFVALLGFAAMMVRHSRIQRIAD